MRKRIHDEQIVELARAIVDRGLPPNCQEWSEEQWAEFRRLFVEHLEWWDDKPIDPAELSAWMQRAPRSIEDEHWRQRQTGDGDDAA